MPIYGGSSGSVIRAGTAVKRDGSSNGKPQQRNEGDSLAGAFDPPIESFTVMRSPRELIVRSFYTNIKTAYAGLTAFSSSQFAGNVYLPPMAIPRTTATTRSIRNKDVNKGGASRGSIPAIFVPGTAK